MINQLKNILRDNLFTLAAVGELENKLFYEGDRQRPYVVRYVVLLILSTVIATFGVIQDSTATVIGAMLVAPLMAPISAITAERQRKAYKYIAVSVLLVSIPLALATYASPETVSGRPARTTWWRAGLRKAATNWKWSA